SSSAGLRYLPSFPTRRSSDLKDVLFPATPVDALLELLVEFLVELDRVRVDARADDLHRFLEVGRRDLLRMLRLAQRDHRGLPAQDRKSTRLNSSHGSISYAVF